MGFIGDFFNLVLITPLTNLFVLLTTLTGNAGVGVIILTIIIRLITLPLTLKQMHGTRAMMAVQPRMQEIQKRYKDPKRRQQEMMKLYREAGINPLGCFSSLLLQMPILIALYRVFIISVGEAPESLIQLSERIYGWDYLRSSLPLPADFLWLHLGRPDPFILPLTVAISTYTLQKMSTLPTTDEKQRAQANMMNLMMPLIFGWITLTLPSGLGLYYALSNIIGMVMQYAYVGGGPVNWRALVGLSQDAVLPKAVTAREQARDRYKGLGKSDGDENEADEDEDAAGSAVAAKTKSPRPSPDQAKSEGGGGRRRRRRYGRGRR
jgi:YidC/Oxa1 family membrane protein insertase